MIDKNTKSYQLFESLYTQIFDKLTKSENTIFENADFRPAPDNYYKLFYESTDYQVYLALDNSYDKHMFVQNWIYENVFLDIYHDVNSKLLTENSSLPYNIEYKLDNTYDVITENIKTASLSTIAAISGIATTALTSGFIFPTLGIALTGLAVTLGLSDTDRKKFISAFEVAGREIGRVLMGDHVLGAKKEVMASANAAKIADSSVDECFNIVNWHPTGSNKITRFIERIFNSNKEYEYARCVGSKLIKFYSQMLLSMYNILKSSDPESKIFDTMENGLKRGALNERVFRNLATLVRNKSSHKLIKTIEQANKAIDTMIDAYANSKDPEYSRLGHDLAKMLDSELRNVAYEISKDKTYVKPAINRRSNEFYKEGTDHQNQSSSYNRNDNRNQSSSYNRNDNHNQSSSYNRNDNRNQSSSYNRNDNRNPF